MILKLVDADNEILKTPTKPIEELSEGISAMIECMIDTLRKTKGVGLSANQVGFEYRIAVIEAPQFLKGPRVLINPEITSHTNNSSIHSEACLSLPGYSCQVKRHDAVIVEYTNRKGKLESLKAKGMLARIIQHEIDHLNGILICDRKENYVLSPL